MLFKFGKFWKITAIILSAWIFYGFFDFEFTIITLLSILIGLSIKDNLKTLF